MMIEKVVSILKNSTGLSGWKINEVRTESVELFFVKKSLDTNRGKDVSHLKLTVYVDSSEDGKKYRGSSTSEIYPTMNDEDIKNVVKRLTFSASLARNEYYPLVCKSEKAKGKVVSNFDKKPLEDWIPDVIDAIYKNDKYKEGRINSAEMFINKNTTRILNSEGVDVNFSGYSAMMEVVANWDGKGETVEVWDDFNFSNFDPEYISGIVDGMLKKSKYKSTAVKTPNVKKGIPVILAGNTVKTLLSYYYNQSSASSVYNKISAYKVGDDIQKDAEGDRLTLELDPYVQNSTLSAPYDSDGYSLSKAEIIKDGVLKRNWGSVRFSHYLGIEPTGNIGNYVVSGGSKSIKELKKDPYLELLSFSDFQTDSITGDFGGEIRLGLYFDGEKVTPVTSGSLSGNIVKAQKNMYFSKELQEDDNFVGPKVVSLSDVSVAGA